MKLLAYFDNTDFILPSFTMEHYKWRVLVRPVAEHGLAQTLLSLFDQYPDVSTVSRKHVDTSVPGISGEQLTAPIRGDGADSDWFFKFGDGRRPLQLIRIHVVRIHLVVAVNNNQELDVPVLYHA